jgi:hypothetical protein
MSNVPPDSEVAGSNKISFEASLLRRATSPELERLCGKLAAWGSKYPGTEIYVPRQTGPPDLRLEDIKTKEILYNLAQIDLFWLEDPRTHESLRALVPTARKAFRLQISDVRRTTSRAGEHFLALLLDEEERTGVSDEETEGEAIERVSGTAFRNETSELWQAMEAKNGYDRGTLSWKNRRPQIELMRIPAGVVPDKAPETLQKLIQRVLPLPVALGAVEFPPHPTD